MILPNAILSIEALCHRYSKERVALDRLSFTVNQGEIMALLGPNGSGKTTLFRHVATLMPIQSGQIRQESLVLSPDNSADQSKIREQLGIVFQSPSLDKKLTILENLCYQGMLYGLHGQSLRKRSVNLLAQFGLGDRLNETVENLSGGLARRVEIAKALLHEPRLLLLDEPSTGLDPGARRELWQQLRTLRAERGVTILYTTHLMEEGEQCDRLLLLDQGRLIALDTPAGLKSRVAGTVITALSPEPEDLVEKVRKKLGLAGRSLDGAVRWEWQPMSGVPGTTAGEWVGALLREFGSQISSVTLSQPNLEDVFIQLTGRKFD